MADRRPPLPANASAQQRLRAFERQEREASVEAARFVMGNPQGRRFVADVLDELEGHGVALWTSSSAEMGRRAALHDEAQRLRGLIEREAPDAYLALLREDQASRTAASLLRASLSTPNEENSNGN